MASEKVFQDDEIQLLCEGKSWRVNREIICSRSEVIAREVNSSMQEGRSRVIEHNEFDSATVEGMVCYLENGRYYVEDERGLQQLDLPSTARLFKESTLVATVLTAHVNVYGIADYYQMSDLKWHAQKNFTAATKHGWQPDGFSDLVRTIFGIYGPRNQTLREKFCAFAVQHRVAIMRQKSLMAELASDPEMQEFLAEMFRRTVQSQVENDERNKANRAQFEKAVRDEQSIREALRKEKQVMTNLVEGIPKLPSTCPWTNTEGEACTGTSPENCKFIRVDDYGDWFVRCTYCCKAMHYLESTAPTRIANDPWSQAWVAGHGLPNDRE